MVRASVERDSERFPTLKLIFDDGIMWQLQRMPLNEAIQIPGTSPPVFVFESNAWRAHGIPPISIGYVETSTGIELVRFTLRLT